MRGIEGVKNPACIIRIHETNALSHTWTIQLGTGLSLVKVPSLSLLFPSTHTGSYVSVFPFEHARTSERARGGGGENKQEERRETEKVVYTCEGLRNVQVCANILMMIAFITLKI